MGVASLVLGICAIVAAFIPGVSLIGGIVGIVGIILGGVAKKKSLPENAGMATGGLICSIIGTILCLIFYIACVACVAGSASAIDSFLK